MKKLLYLIVLAPIYGICQPAQKMQPEKEISNAERFSERSGILIQREFADVAVVRGCKIQVATFIDLLSDSKTKALRIEKDVGVGVAAEVKVALIDADEVDALIKSLKILQSRLFNTTPSNYTEAFYRSRSGLECGGYTDDKKKWGGFLKLDRYSNRTFISLKIDDLTQLIAGLEKAMPGLQ